MASGRFRRGLAGIGCAVCVAVMIPSPGSGLSQEPVSSGLESWLSTAMVGLDALSATADAELARTGTQRLLRIYLDNFEQIENWYGPGAPHGVEPLSAVVARGEARFHRALQSTDPVELRDLISSLRSDFAEIRLAAIGAGVPMTPEIPQLSTAAAVVSVGGLRTSEIRSIADAVERARRAYSEGRREEALRLVEQTYLQEFEPMEARLPGGVTREIESLIHLRLRPMLARGAAVADVDPVFAALNGGLVRADASLAAGSSFWFGAVNAFAIIVREGLEAVLLIAALLAYLTGMGAARKERVRIWAGVGLGVIASFATWGVARTLVPVSGASREVLEGVTAIVAVVVLLYVSHWLFQKTYIHDWKEYLRTRVGRAMTAGSAIAMAGLAFAAVYREGFETVLFYQALLFDTSSGAVLAGFAPGMLLIVGVGAAILRLGVKLPLKQLFAVTNTILLLLAFVFLGKGMYNLQEAGLFAPHPVGWVPDSLMLRQVLGIYPLVETLLAQGILLSLLAGTMVFYWRRRRSNTIAAPGVARAAGTGGDAQGAPADMQARTTARHVTAGASSG